MKFSFPKSCEAFKEWVPEHKVVTYRRYREDGRPERYWRKETGHKSSGKYLRRACKKCKSTWIEVLILCRMIILGVRCVKCEWEEMYD